MSTGTFVSAAAMQRARVRRFLGRNMQTCACSKLEVRQEGGLLRCERCDAPLVPRKASGVRDLRRARIERVLNELRALQRMADDFEAEVLAAAAVAAVVRLGKHLPSTGAPR